MEQSPEDTICPLLRFPPLALLPLFFVPWHGIGWDLKVDHLEEEVRPWDEALLALLVLAQLEDDTPTVCFKDEMQDGWDVLRGARRGRGE